MLIINLLQQGSQSELARSWSVWTSIIIPLVAAIGGMVLGSYLSYRLTKCLYEKERDKNLIQRRLDQLYSPILGLGDEIKALNQSTFELHHTTSETWKELVEEAQERGGVEAVYNLESRHPEYTEQIELGNRILRETIIPYYERMIEIIRDNHWLADSKTMDYFPDLVRFVFLWQGWLDRKIAREVIEKYSFKEENLANLFDHLEQNQQELAARIGQD